MTIHDERDPSRFGSGAEGRLELARVRELLRRYVPEPPAKVADIGGGPGVHAKGLRADGYDVRMLNPVARQVEDEEFDAAFLSGLMHSLVHAADRRAALREAIRVTKYGGFVAAVAVNRTAAPRAHAAYHTVAQLRSELTGAGLRAVSIHGLTVAGGWLSPMVDDHYQGLALPDSPHEPDPLQTALECSRLADLHPELVQSSSLLFGIGQRD
ncbi:methyltransferase domain-containing protein [Kribbella sp. NBC_01505]|uniref:class I SAM-dependent methyltransferase n=1 Tax=Kribbella sp. NBC_01505 TaxID=2903580 RepID=UPI00386BF8C6